MHYPHQQYKLVLNSLSKGKRKQEKIRKLSVGRAMRELGCVTAQIETRY